MTRLTEEMVIARTRASDLGNIKKLNCWGSELSDVSLLRRMKNVEVLSLSVNKISTLADFQHCQNLQELYVRKNNIRDLSEICYLRELPKLRNLWLEENPCAEAELYRLTVLKNLPRLQKLDNVTVEPEELQDAMRKGRELVHPEEIGDASPERWPSQSSSPARSPSNIQESPPARRPQVPDRLQEAEQMRRMSIQDDEPECFETDRRNANYEHDTGYRRPSVPDVHAYENQVHGNEDPRHIVNQHYERTYKQVQQQIASASQRLPAEKGTNHRPYPSRPKTRNSNILSAVLCLVKELDYPSLEVVEMAVRCRMDELED